MASRRPRVLIFVIAYRAENTLERVLDRIPVSLFASYQTIVEGDWPTWGMLAPIVPWTVGLFVVGCWLFLRHEREFAVRL